MESQYEELVNTFIADEHCCSASLPQKQAKLLADKAWKAASHGTDEATVSEILCTSSNVSDENIVESHIVPMPKCCMPSPPALAPPLV